MSDFTIAALGVVWPPEDPAFSTRFLLFTVVCWHLGGDGDLGKGNGGYIDQKSPKKFGSSSLSFSWWHFFSPPTTLPLLRWSEKTSNDKKIREWGIIGIWDSQVHAIFFVLIPMEV